jgi:hypothetical protein
MWTREEVWGWLKIGLYLILILGVAGLLIWSQVQDYQDCIRDGNPRYLCRGLLK